MLIQCSQSGELGWFLDDDFAIVQTTLRDGWIRKGRGRGGVVDSVSRRYVHLD